MAPREKAVFEKYLEVIDPTTAAPTPEPQKAVWELKEEERAGASEENGEGEGEES